MEKVLTAQNRHWSGQKYTEVVARECFPWLLKLLKLKEVLVLLGVRRCGKTTLFRQIMNHLTGDVDPKAILYINLDDPCFDNAAVDAKYLYTIIENAERLTNTKVHYLFLDEVQNIPGWEKFVKSVYDSGSYKKIFITGSNSKLLNGDYPTLLSGRYVDHTLYPLNVREILQMNALTDELTIAQHKPKLLSIMDSLLTYGSFPEPFLQEDVHLKRKLLVSYYETILLKDCVAVNSIRDVRLLKELAHYLITNTGSLYSYNNLTNVIAGSEHTIKDYITVLQQGYLFNELKTFAFSLKKQSRAKKKLYCIDNGLISSIAFQFANYGGQLFENLVQGELRKLGVEEMFFFNELYECDFVIKHHDKFIPIQVCYKLTNENRKREFRGLQNAIDKLSCPKGLIITFDQQEPAAGGIEVLPFWKLFNKFSRCEDLFLEFT